QLLGRVAERGRQLACVFGAAAQRAAARLALGNLAVLLPDRRPEALAVGAAFRLAAGRAVQRCQWFRFHDQSSRIRSGGYIGPKNAPFLPRRSRTAPPIADDPESAPRHA